MTRSLWRTRSQALPSPQKGSWPCNPQGQARKQPGPLHTPFPLLLPVPTENNGVASASFQPRPAPLQTDPESKTSSVWATGEKSDDWALGRSTQEGSGKGLRLSSARRPRIPGLGPRRASPGLQPALRDVSLPPETHAASRPCRPPPGSSRRPLPGRSYSPAPENPQRHLLLTTKSHSCTKVPSGP